MFAFLTLFLSLPRDLRYHIWSFFLDTYAMEMAQEYRLTTLSGENTLATVPVYTLRPDRQLAYRMVRNYRRGIGSHMRNLFKAHRQGRNRHVGTILKINLHTLFTTDRRFLGRTKKVIIFALQLRLVTKIELQVWDYISGMIVIFMNVFHFIYFWNI